MRMHQNCLGQFHDRPQQPKGNVLRVLAALSLATFALLLHPSAAQADSISCYRLDSGAVNCIDYDTGNEWEQSPPVVGETGDGPSCVGGYITSQLC
jgi:hypothetical protein